MLIGFFMNSPSIFESFATSVTKLTNRRPNRIFGENALNWGRTHSASLHFLPIADGIGEVPMNFLVLVDRAVVGQADCLGRLAG